jgi:CRP-like cAMP-binding protein
MSIDFNYLEIVAARSFSESTPGTYIGYISLLVNAKRTATVQAKSRPCA